MTQPAPRFRRNHQNLPGGNLSLARHGANDESFSGTSEQYLPELRRRYEHQP